MILRKELSLNLLSTLGREKIVIISTHIVSDIEFIANEIIMIKNHKLLYKDSIENLCAVIDGKVYEKEMTFSESIEFRKKYLVLSEKQESGNVRLKFISEEKREDFIRVKGNLEDLFLYEYRDEEF